MCRCYLLVPQGENVQIYTHDLELPADSGLCLFVMKPQDTKLKYKKITFIKLKIHMM